MFESIYEQKHLIENKKNGLFISSIYYMMRYY